MGRRDIDRSVVDVERSIKSPPYGVGPGLRMERSHCVPRRSDVLFLERSRKRGKPQSGKKPDDANHDDQLNESKAFFCHIIHLVGAKALTVPKTYIVYLQQLTNSAVRFPLQTIAQNATILQITAVRRYRTF
jgi:hypothetical protein